MFVDVSNPVNVNPSSSPIHLTRGADDWLWAVFTLMALSTLAMIFWSHRRPLGQRVFHHIPVIVLTTMTVAYFAMASNLGRTGVLVEFSHASRSGVRDIFWVRWVMWFICAPLLILMLLLTTGVALSDVFLTIFMSWVWIVCYLVGALVVTRYKWGFWAIGTAALLYVIWLKLGHSRRSIFPAGPATRTGYTAGAGYLSFFWLIYPIAWACCEGSNLIGIAGEMIWYGILDLITGPIFLFFVLHRLRNMDYNALGLYSAKHTGYQGLNGAGPGMVGNTGAGVNAGGTTMGGAPAGAQTMGGGPAGAQTMGHGVNTGGAGGMRHEKNATANTVV